MVEASGSKRYDVPGAEMWERIGDPGAIHRWHPAIEATQMTDAGATRINTLTDGGLVSETVLDRGHRHHTWRINDSPLPMANFVATIRVVDAEDSACEVRWDATFDPTGISDADAVELARGFFQAGLDAL